ncbi:MAG TPA: VOC family protein [Polyangiaceae bacterium]|nr:VOC family protein [Polyangiaceae bacterium]
MSAYHQHPALRGAIAAFAISLLSSPRLSAESQAPTNTSPALVTAVEGVEVVVSDLSRSRSFYESLGFISGAEEELSGTSATQRTGLARAQVRRVQLTLGKEQLTLVQYLSPTDGRPVPLDSKGNDLWFQHVAIVVSDMDRAFAWLRSQHVAYVSSEPQTLPRWNHAAAGIQAFYFADPDGHTLELIHFPKQKGDPRWHTRTTCARAPAEMCLFLGIDHTAITVSDTEQSLALYRTRLGMLVTGESENYGPEQEHLNGVFGARLHITTLRASHGPGIELLQYLAPRGGRPMPHDARANDLFQWQVVVRASESRLVAEAAEATGGRAISRAPETGAVFVRDRDGHALLARGRTGN